MSQPENEYVTIHLYHNDEDHDISKADAQKIVAAGADELEKRIAALEARMPAPSKTIGNDMTPEQIQEWVKKVGVTFADPADKPTEELPGVGWAEEMRDLRAKLAQAERLHDTERDRADAAEKEREIAVLQQGTDVVLHNMCRAEAERERDEAHALMTSTSKAYEARIEQLNNEMGLSQNYRIVCERERRERMRADAAELALADAEKYISRLEAFRDCFRSERGTYEASQHNRLTMEAAWKAAQKESQ